MEDLKNKIQEFVTQNKKLNDENQQKDLTMQVLKSEMEALRVFYIFFLKKYLIFKNDNEKFETDIKNLKIENENLVNRLVQEKEIQAQKMNEITDMYNEMVKQVKQLELEKKNQSQKESDSTVITTSRLSGTFSETE